MREQLPHSLRVADGVLNSNEVWVAYLERFVAPQLLHLLRVADGVLNSHEVWVAYLERLVASRTPPPRPRRARRRVFRSSGLVCTLYAPAKGASPGRARVRSTRPLLAVRRAVLSPADRLSRAAELTCHAPPPTPSYRPA
jgi:hypothetical protein